MVRRLPALFLFALSALLAFPVAAAGRQAGALDWLAEYLRIDTSNPPGQEGRAAAYLATLLARQGIPARLIVNPAGRVSVYARLRAAAPGAPALLLTHHLDVVPPGPGWTVDPFGGTVSDGRIWGRGAIDTKGLGIVHLAALANLARQGCTRTRDVAFLAVPDEELGGGQGMGWLTEHQQDLFLGVEAVYNEGGVGRMSGDGRLLWWEIEVAQKRPLWLEAKTAGRGGHASALSPNSPNHRLIAALARLIELKMPYHLTQPARDYLREVAKLQVNPRQRKTLENIEQVLRPEGPTELLHPGFHRIFLDTLQVTVMRASDSINVIAPEASAKIDVRLLPDTDEAAFKQRIRETLGRDVEVTVLLSVPPSPSSSASSRAYNVARQVLEQDAAVVPSLSSGFTDSRFFRQRGIDAYGVSPFALVASDAAGVHAADERLPLADLDRGIERMSRMLALWACGDE